MYLFAFFLVLYEFTTYSANDMIMPGMIQVIRELQAEQIYVALSLSIYLLGTCLFLLAAGFCSERYGKRRVILAGNLLFLVFTLAIIFSNNIHQFMLYRFLQGSGLAIIAIGYAIIHARFNDKAAIKLAALMANVSILAPLLGPVIGSIIVDYSSWKYVFLLTALLGICTFGGLYRTTPYDQPTLPTASFYELSKQYITILRNKEFFQGTLCSVFSVMTLLLWISQAPNLILYKLKLSYLYYVIYQLISISGLLLSSILMQYIAGTYSFYRILKIGSSLLLFGSAICLLGFDHLNMVVAGLAIYALGMGLANGCILRLIMTIKGHRSGMVATMLGFLQTFLFAVVITVMNKYYAYFDFSLLSFTLSVFMFGAIAFLLTRKISSLYRDRNWL